MDIGTNRGEEVICEKERDLEGANYAIKSRVVTGNTSLDDLEEKKMNRALLDADQLQIRRGLLESKFLTSFMLVVFLYLPVKILEVISS